MATPQARIISSDTLNPFTLLPLFYGVLCTLNGAAASKLAAAWAGTFPADFDGLNLYHVRDMVERGAVDMDAVGYLLDAIMDALRDAAPAGTYFGSAVGDGACFGFFPVGTVAEEWDHVDDPADLARDLLGFDHMDRPDAYA